LFSHHHKQHSVNGGTSSGFGGLQAMSFSTPDNEKDVHLMGVSST